MPLTFLATKRKWANMILIGYMRVSKNDGSQVLDLQRDALIAAGITEDRIYQDRVSGKKELRPGLQSGSFPFLVDHRYA